MFSKQKLKDGVFNPDGFLKAITAVIGDDDPNIAVLQEIVGECKGISDADRCEYTFKLMQCGDKTAKARGISFVTIFD